MSEQPPSPAVPRLALRPREAAAALGIDERTLRAWMRDEGLPYLRVARGAVLIPCRQLEAWLAERVQGEHQVDAHVDAILEELKEGPA